MSEEININSSNFGNLLACSFWSFQESYCHIYIIQVLLVGFGYFCVGKGRYWKTLFYASIAGLCGFFFQLIGLCSSFNFFLFIGELCMIFSDFSIPFLNMVKLEAIIPNRRAKYLKIALAIPFLLFSTFKIIVGYLRTTEDAFTSKDILSFNGYANAILAITELLCTTLILIKMTEDYKMAKSRGLNGNIYKISKNSSYFTLLFVDLFGTVSAVLSIFAHNLPKIIYNATIPLLIIQSCFILLLAVDALIFKVKSFDSRNNNSSMNNLVGSNEKPSICINSNESKPNAMVISSNPY